MHHFHWVIMNCWYFNKHLTLQKKHILILDTFSYIGSVRCQADDSGSLILQIGVSTQEEMSSATILKYKMVTPRCLHLCWKPHCAFISCRLPFIAVRGCTHSGKGLSGKNNNYRLNREIQLYAVYVNIKNMQGWYN